MKYEPVAKDRDEKMLDVHDLEIDVDPDESMMSDNSYGVDVYVSAIVPQTDDPSTPSLTFRVIVLGTIWNVFLAAANSIFMFRTNPVMISSSMATLLSYPMGIAMAHVLPRRVFNFCGFKWSMNPGIFSVKEHVLISIIASAGGGLAYGVDNVVTQKFEHYMGNNHINFWNSLAFVMSVQMVGFGMAGILRRFLVKPAAMYWPGILSQVALFVGFHEQVAEDPNSKYKMSRFRFFWIAVGIFFVYTWLPEYFLSVLTSFSLLCFVTQNKMVRFLSSSSWGNGIGLGAITLNWNYIGGYFLTSPYWATVQWVASGLIWGWIVTPILFVNNHFGADTLVGDGNWALNRASLFNSTGNAIQPIILMDKTTYDLDVPAYNVNAPIYITTFFAIQYGTNFMAIAAAISHVALWYGKSIRKQFKDAFSQKDTEDDIHNRLMRAYPEVPEWCYVVFLAAMVLVQVAVSVWTPFTMPIWSVFLCLAIALFFLLPIGIITAVTGMQLGLNVLTEFVIGLMIPGQTIAVMAFKSLGTNTIIQAMGLIGDLKLGHYMKINPIHMVFAQLYGTVIGAFVNNGVSIWAETLLKEIIFIDKEWLVQSYATFYSAGAIWGSIGPQRFFGIGSVYEDLLWFFLAGFLLPFVPWIGNKIYKSSYWHYINIPLLASGGLPAGYFQVAIIAPLFVGWFFQHYLFHKHQDWWKKYNYTLAIASDVGVAMAILVITAVTAAGVHPPVGPLNPATDPDYYCLDEPWYK